MTVIVEVTPSNVNECLLEILSSPYIGFDTETTALHPKDGKLRLIQLAVRGKSFILDCFKYSAELLRPVFSGDHILIGHNLGFDLRFLMSVGIELPHGKNLFDTMIAGLLLDAGLIPRPSHSLAAMVERIFGVVLDKLGQVSNWSGHLEQWQLEYAAKDAQILLDLYCHLRVKIAEANLERTMGLEMRALPGVAWFTYSGIPINREKWERLAVQNAMQAENLEYALAEQTSSKDMFGWSHVNWRSPAQVLKEFNDHFVAIGRTKTIITTGADGRKRRSTVPFTIEDTGDETLAALAADGDELAKLLLQYRRAGKLRDTYGHEWANKFIHKDGRVYADYIQCGPYSGRMAARDPNIQQIPHGKDFRSCFEAPDGESFTISDFSQIELRIVVDITNDPVGMRAYCVDNTDLHKSTAELILGIDLKNDPIEKVKEARQVAKSLNFGLIYGAGSETLRKYALSAFKVNLSPEKAADLRNAWRNIYKGIVSWQRSVRDGVEVVWTQGGRRRLNVDKFTEKLNTPVQGTGADGLKAAIALCWERRHLLPNGVRPAALVHDEIVFTSKTEDELAVGEWVKYNMERGMQNFMKNVPVVAEPSHGKNWADK